MPAAVDTFDAQKPGLSSPAEDGVAVTPSDDNDLVNVSRWIWVGGAGNLKVTLLKGTTVTLVAVPVGTLLPLRVKRVFATLTTATNIVALQ